MENHESVMSIDPKRRGPGRPRDLAKREAIMMGPTPCSLSAVSRRRPWIAVAERGIRLQDDGLRELPGQAGPALSRVRSQKSS